MQFQSAIVTVKGKELLSAASINNRIVFTRFEFQGSNVTLTENSTNLSNRWGNGHVDSYETNSLGEFIIYASASNENSHGYAYGWGVWGKLESNQQEFLLFVANYSGTVTYVDSMSGAATRFLLALTVHYSIDDVVMTIDPSYSGLVSNVEFQSLLNRTVTTHSAASTLIGDDQTILGDKTFDGALTTSGSVLLGGTSAAATKLNMTPPDNPNGSSVLQTRSPVGTSVLSQTTENGAPVIKAEIKYNGVTDPLASVVMNVNSSNYGICTFTNTGIFSESVYPRQTESYGLGNATHLWYGVYADVYRGKTGVVVGEDRYADEEVSDGEVRASLVKSTRVVAGDPTGQIQNTPLYINGAAVITGEARLATCYADGFVSDGSEVSVYDDVQTSRANSLTFGPSAWCMIHIDKINSNYVVDTTVTRCVGIKPDMRSNGILFFDASKPIPQGIAKVKVIVKLSNGGWGYKTSFEEHSVFELMKANIGASKNQRIQCMDYNAASASDLALDLSNTPTFSGGVAYRVLIEIW